MVIRVSCGRIAGAVAVACLLACCKRVEDSKDGNEPAAAQERRASAAGLAVPAGLFAHIPADTPYVFASTEAAPSSYWERLAPFVLDALDQVPQPEPTAGPAERFALAFLREFKNAGNQGGLPRLLGIGPSPRFALYGIGLIPVMRLELADSKSLAATVARVEHASGVVLPTASLGGQAYWRFAEGKALAVAAVAGDQLVVSAGPVDMVEKALPFILGMEKPSRSMADGGQLKKVVAQHGFAGYGVGYVDAQNLVKLLLVHNLFRAAGSGNAVPPACMEKLTALARRFPRLVCGYDEFSDKRIAMRMVLETEPALASRLRQLVVAVPGLVGGRSQDRVLVALGLGVDLNRARQLLHDATGDIASVGAACGSEGVAEDMAGARATLSSPLPPGLDKLRGVLIALLDADVGPDRTPRGVEAYGILATDDPAGLLRLINKQMPGRIPEVAADGQFHDIVPAGTLPGLSAVRAAIKPAALVAAVGAKGTAAAEQALARTGSSPLFYISYDYGKLMEKFMAGAGPGPLLMNQKKLLSLLGVVTMSSYPTEQGLTLAMSMDFD